MVSNNSVGIKCKSNIHSQFTSSKAPTCTLNTITFDQILAIPETIIFFGLHLDMRLLWTSHENILLKKLSCVCFMMRTLHTKHGYIKNSLLCTLSATDSLRYNCLGVINNHAQCIFNTKRIIRNMLGLGTRSSCRRGLRN